MRAIAFDIIEDIIKTEGDCLNEIRCSLCPLRDKCHSSILNALDHKARKKRRVQIAKDIICDSAIFNERCTNELPEWE
jgi:hypothetical protein